MNEYSACRLRDHPRTRGEKGKSHPELSLTLGSPPHTRGKAVDNDSHDLVEGDHPRTRGEKFYQLARTYGREGSPPHTRGKEVAVTRTRGSAGITPAHAGKSISYCFCYWSCWDHPRTRGEKPSSCCFRVFRTGSPPHTRGKDQLVKANVFSGRITPAHAGKSVIERNSRRIRQDHPRTRGEKSGTSTTAGDEEASPPHTRGKVSPP